jgi:hypothetical protein
MQHTPSLVSQYTWSRWDVLPLWLSIALARLIVASVSAAGVATDVADNSNTAAL